MPVAKVAVVAAPTMTAGAVGLGVVTAEGVPASSAQISTQQISTAATLTQRDDIVDKARTKAANRSLDRSATVPAQVVKRFATDDLDIRRTPAADAQVDTTISSGTLIKATGVTDGDYAQVLWQGQLRWVTASYLSAKRPVDPASIGLSDKPCPDMSVEHGLVPDAVRVYRAVCNAFPDISSYGGWDAHGEHASGKAIDIMHPSVEEGYKIAAFLQAHAAELHLYDVIWRQHIWTPVRSSEGWRLMPNRGSLTANHFDHVHVSVN